MNLTTRQTEKEEKTESIIKLLETNQNAEFKTCRKHNIKILK